MNDLDLRTALHRDADLAGAPPADLLDRLASRRQQQRRRRAGGLGAVAAVVVIAAGIPIGASFMTQSDGGPATRPVDPVPSVTAEVDPPAMTPPPAPPSVAVVPSTAPPAASTPPDITEPSAGAAVPPTEAAPPCDWAAIDAALPADTPERTYALYSGDGEFCLGAWAASGYNVTEVFEGEVYVNSNAALFHYVDGAWVFLDRTPHCDDTVVPPAIWERACNVD